MPATDKSSASTSLPGAHAGDDASTAVSAIESFFMRRSLRALTDAERNKLIEAQVEATRPIVSGVVASGAMILALVGMFEAAGVTPSLGWPWWVVELVAVTVGGCGLAILHLSDWRPRLLLAVLSVVLVGIFLSVPMPGVEAITAGRVGLFHLMPIALLALMVRRVSILAIAGAMLGVALVRATVNGIPASGAALYWLATVVTIGFGLLLGGYRTDFAVSTFRIRQRLRAQATTDELTGLRNRAGWNREAGDAYDDAMRRGRPASVAFFDIDHFKRVNDTHGHAAGDQVIQKLGQILRERAGRRCLCARLGGEEFVALLVDETADSVEGFVQRVRKEFADAAADVGVTVSAGVAHRIAAESMGQHMRRADLALYEAKAAGRDRMVVSQA